MIKPGPEHARLAEMVGTWDAELGFVFKAGDPPVKAHCISRITLELGGMFIQERIEGLLGEQPIATSSWTGFNTFTNHYEATRMASTNTIRILESGVYDEKLAAFVLTAAYPFAGDTWTQRTIIKHAKDTMDVDVFMSFGKTPEWKGCTITYRRR